MTEEAQKPRFLELARQALSRTDRGYDLLAPKFETTDYATPIPMIEASLERVDELYPISKSQESRGADLACGTGRGSRALRRYCERVDGFDFSAGMLKEAERLSAGVDGLFWRKCDLSTLTLSPNTYDRIVTFGAWGHILPTFRMHLLEQTLGSLKPGGVFITLSANEPSVWERRFWYYLLFDLLIKLRNQIWFHEFHMYYRLNSTEQLMRSLSQASDQIQPNWGRLEVEPLPESEYRAISLVTFRRDRQSG